MADCQDFPGIPKSEFPVALTHMNLVNLLAHRISTSVINYVMVGRFKTWGATGMQGATLVPCKMG